MDLNYIALISGIIGIATAILSSIMSFLQSKKITKLNHELSTKKIKDEEIIKFVLNYEMQNIESPISYLKDYMKITQYNKDKLKELINKYDNLFFIEIRKILEGIKDELIEQYSKSVYYFNKVDQEKIAHNIKNIFCEIVDEILSNQNFNKQSVNDKIKLISDMQSNLQASIENSINNSLSELKNQSR